MRRIVLAVTVVIMLFLVPNIGNLDNTWESRDSVNNERSLESRSSPIISSDLSSGTGVSLPYYMVGQATNKYDNTMTIDSSSSGETSIALDSGFTGSGLQASVDGITIQVNDIVRNDNLDTYHNEKFLGTANAGDDVAVPDSWTLTKVGDSLSTHPNHGIFRFNDIASAGYSGTMGWQFQASWAINNNLSDSDEIHISQFVHFPYRELYSAEVSFRYYVSSSSNLENQVFLFARFAGYQQNFQVFLSGSTTDTWLQGSMSIPIGTIDSISLPHSLLLEVGLGTDLSGSQSNARNAYVYVDDVSISAEVRPYPEQVNLKANGTLVTGWTPGNIYVYEPDANDRDCWSSPGTGLDLSGNPYVTGEADPTVGVYGSSSWGNAQSSQTGIQFLVDIPQGAVITHAYLEVEPLAAATNAEDVDMRIYVSGFDSGGGAVSAFTSGTPELQARYEWVETSIDWDIGARWVSQVRIRHKSPDIAPLLQGVVSSSDWSSGNHVVVMLDFMHASGFQSRVGIKGAYGTRFSADEIPRLFVEYRIPLPEDTVYLMSYEKDITIDHTQVTGDLSNFPVMVELFDTDLRTKVQASGNDITFKMGDMPLDFEIELFNQAHNSSHAHLVAWVKIPSLSSTANTKITMMYGNPDAPSMSSTHVWDDFALVQHMNDNPAGTMYDSTSNNNHGTSYGSMTSGDLVSGQIDGATEFDGVDDIVSVGQIYTDDWAGFTMSAWVRQDESRDCRILSKSSTTTPAEHIMTMRIDGQNPTFRIRTDGTGGSGNNYNSNGSLTLGQWHHIVWMWSAADSRMLAYLDGNPILDVSHGGATIYDSVEVFTIGNNDLTNSRYLLGVIDEVRLTTSILPKNWITTEYNNQLAPSSFYSVGTERALDQSYDEESSPTLMFTTSSDDSVNLITSMNMEIEGSGQTLDENFEEGTSYFVLNGSEFVNWTAKVLVSPPNTTADINVYVDYPMTEWGPTKILNPLDQEKTYGTDWDYDGGTIIIYNSAVDIFGVWTIKFISANYVNDLQLGISGQPLSHTATLNINDDLKLKVTSPWIQDARAGLVLTDPSDTVWHTDYNTTGAPGTAWNVPSLSYRMPLTVAASKVNTDVTGFPLLLDITDSNLQMSSKVQANGNDFVFVQDGAVVPHELESFNQSAGKLIAWVRLDLSSSVDNTFYMYYGNPYVGSCENKTGVWTNAYEAVWHLNEPVTLGGSGEMHYDSTGNGYHGIHHGNSRADGQINYAQEFDGIDDFISVNSSKELDPSGDITISGWFCLDAEFTSSSSTQVLISKYLDIDRDMVLLLAGTDFSGGSAPSGSLVWKVESSKDNPRYKWTTTTTWSSGWYRFSVYLDSDNMANNNIYINGVDVTNSTDGGSGTTADLSYSADWTFGGGYYEPPTDSLAYFEGRLDEIRVSTTSRTSGWISTEYDNQLDPASFFQKGSESQRVSPEHTFTKTINSTAGAGIWTASVYYNDTGTHVSTGTGIMEREFLVKHDSSLSLISPGDAVSGGISVRIAGDLLYVEVELTDDVNSDSIPGSTVTMNWTVSGTPTEVNLEDYGDGRYGKALNTSDLADAGRWFINISSTHPYYNDASLSFHLDLSHKTEILYETPPSTPYGDDFTVRIFVRNAFDGSPLSGATISSNGTIVGTPTDHGNGTYTITLDSEGLSVGNYVYRITATPSQTYMLASNVDIIFTLRDIYTATYAEGGNSVSTPYQVDTTATITYNDVDHYSAGISGASWQINKPASISITITDMSDGEYLVEITVGTTSPGTYNIDITMSKANYEDSTIRLKLTISPRDTFIVVDLDNPVPWGHDSAFSVTWYDSTSGAMDITGVVSVSSVRVDDVSYGSSLSFTYDSSPLTVDIYHLNVTVISADANYKSAWTLVTLEIRAHYTIVSVSLQPRTPWGFDTEVQVIFWDVDDNVQVPIGNVSDNGIVFDSVTYGTQSFDEDYSPILNTDTWAVGVYPISLTVSCVLDNKYYTSASTSFDLTIRARYTTLSVEQLPQTPWGFDTSVKIVFWDVDGNVQVPIGQVHQIQFSPTGYDSQNFSDTYSPTLVTNNWNVSTVITIVTVTALDSNLKYDGASATFDIVIRTRYTIASASVHSSTPWGFDTEINVTFWDLDADVQVPLDNVSSIIINPGEYSEQSFLTPGTYLLTLNTDFWTVGVVSAVVTVTCTDEDLHYKTASSTFSITIRKHYTSLSVKGNMTTTYGGNTSVSIVFWDTDTNTQVPIENVSIIEFNIDGYENQNTKTYTPTLDTENWSVGTVSVVASIFAVEDNRYYASDTHSFTISIESLRILLYNEPSDLIFPNGDDFFIILGVKVSQPGNQYHNDPVLGLTVTEFTAENSTHTYSIAIDNLGNGRYNLTIAASYFAQGTYTITVSVDPSDAIYGSDLLEITFQYRPARSFLSSPNYPLVVTPFGTDVVISLNYTDVDRNMGISGGEISANGILIYGQTDFGNGLYEITINVTGLSKGDHLFSLTASAADYESKILDFTVRIRIVFTYAIPTVGALDIPVGNSPIFYVEYWDIDHDVPVTGATLETNWTHTLTAEYIEAEQRYRIVFITYDDDPLEQNRVVQFNFSKGADYQFGIFTISVTIRTHSTDFRLVSAVEPTSYKGIINISVYYGDIDNNVGIDSEHVSHRVVNGSGSGIEVLSTLDNQGSGYYIIRIDAAQFGKLGMQSFLVYFNWTGSVYTYQNKTLSASANILGEDSAYTLLTASEPTPYLGNMSYLFFYSEVYSGEGITNSTGDVHISVQFQGISVDLSQVDIWEVGGGNYSIRFNTTTFGRIGLIYMSVYINWSKGVSPFYTNRTDTISVRVLARDTLIALVPPSPTPYGENATFSFVFEDVSGGSAPIANDPALDITLSLSDYTLTYNPDTREFTVSFDTSQSPIGDEPLGQKSFILNVEWHGAPFYANRTGRTVLISVTERQTVLDFQSPAPTPYQDNVTFTLIWTDVTGTAALGIEGATVTLLDGETEIPSIYYLWSDLTDGIYSVELNTTYYASPGTFDLKVTLTTPEFYILDITRSRQFIVQYRITLLSPGIILPVAYNSSIDFELYFQDRFTLGNIGNLTELVTFSIVEAGWTYTIQWNEAFGYYEVSIDTYNHPELEVDTPYSLQLNMSYADEAPFYRWDDAYITFRLRTRISALELDEAPLPTPYLDYVDFSVFYRDVDGDFGIGSASLTVYKGVDPLNPGSDYVALEISDGLWVISVNTTSLDGLGITTVRVWANWTASAPYHQNRSLNLDLRVTLRATNVEIIAPPSQAQFLDNVTFTFAFIDLGTGNPITAITINDIRVYNHLTLLSYGDYILISVGSNYEIQINSTVISSALVTNRNITVLIDWDQGVAPYYADDQTSLKVTTTNRFGQVSIGQVLDTPYLDLMNISFTFSDQVTDTGIEGGIIVFSCVEVPGLSEGTNYSIYAGTGIDAGQYIISIDTESLGSIGTFTFSLAIHWNPAQQPYYRNTTTFILKGSTRLIQTSVSSEAPSPATVPLNDVVSVVIYLTDVDHDLPIDDAEGSISVVYKSTGLSPVSWSIDFISDGAYNITVNTGDAGTPGTKALIISIAHYPYLNLEIQVAFQLRYRIGVLSVEYLPDAFYAGDPAYVIVSLTDSDAGNAPLEGASLTLTWPDSVKSWTDIGSGQYNISLGSGDLDYGIQNLRISTSLDDFSIQLISLDLNLLAVTTSLTPLDDSYTLYWGYSQEIAVYLMDTVHDVPIPGATVTYQWSTHDGSLIEQDVGNYTEILDTSLVSATTVVVRITASAPNYVTVSTQITLSILPLPVEMQPTSGEFGIRLPRGAIANIEIQLMTTEGSSSLVDGASITYSWEFGDGGFSDESGGIYIAGVPTELAEVGSYTVTIIGLKPNYLISPLTMVITLDQTRINVDFMDENQGLVDGTQEAYYWSEEMVLGVYVYAPDLNGTNPDRWRSDSNTSWSMIDRSGQIITGFLLNGSLAPYNEPGFFYVVLNTSQFNAGTYTLRIRGSPANPAYATNTTTVTLVIRSIQTAIEPPDVQPMIWGGTQIFYFEYIDLDRLAYVQGAIVTYVWAGDEGAVQAIDVQNGTYGVFIDTSKVLPSTTSYSVEVSFAKDNFDSQKRTLTIRVNLVPTEIVVYSPDLNQIDGPRNLQVPYGDSITVNVFYNSTASPLQTPYVGGIPGAQIGEGTSLNQPSLGGLNFSLTDLGNGNYSFTLDSLDYMVADGFQYYIVLELANRTRAIVRVTINIIDVPTELDVPFQEINMYYGNETEIIVYYQDSWPGHGAIGVPDARVEIATSNTAVNATYLGPVEGQPGAYRFMITAERGLLPNVNQQLATITITFHAENYESQSAQLQILLGPSPADQTLSATINLGTPIGLIALIFVILYVRVFSVPKRLRQINGQIKALRKGNIPKPISEAKPREVIVADYFNDTYAQFNEQYKERQIRRTADQMPVESVKVDIPEMGELLVQLSILTNLSPEELDEFKADISKMKMSEQAAFVKEVIHQEAIRAARRENKSIEEIMESISYEAKVKIGDEDVTLAPERESILDRSRFLIEDEVVEKPDVDTAKPVRTPRDDLKEFDTTLDSSTDKLSQFEIEELKKELERKGVPPYEIDTIIEQARELPRDLVEELVRSLTDKE